MTTYLLAGGGTAGHVNPLLALADLIRVEEPESTVLALGTKEGLESRLVPERGYELLTIDRLPFPRRPNLEAVRFPARYRRAVTEVRDMIRTRSVDVVVGFGGYASAPAYRAAKHESIPSIIHEANAKPGLANLLGARSAARVAVTFAGTPIRGAEVTGMPLRPEIVNLDRAGRRAEARTHFGLHPERETLLVTGGSLGARAINEGISSMAEEIVAAGIQVLHVWGGLTELQDPGISGYQVLPYCDRMDLAFAAATLAVSRAGSTTVSEVSALGLPTIFVPYGHGNGEQRLNARGVVEAGGALMIEDGELTSDFVRETVIPLSRDAKRLADMEARSRSVGITDGTERLYRMVQEVLSV